MTAARPPEPEQDEDEVAVFVDAFRLAARQAGAVARRFQATIPLGHKDGYSSPEGSALTTVDLVAQDVLLYALAERLPRIAVDAEEETDSVALFPEPASARSLVVVDPIDGTLNYARGSRDYAVMGALVRDGLYQAAVVHFPAWGAAGISWWARRGGGCFRQEGGRGEPTRVRVDDRVPRLITTPWMPPPLRAALGRLGGELQVSSCSAVDAGAPAFGVARASIAGHPPDRRRAIAFLLTVEAGGVIELVPGRHWQGEDPATFSGLAGPHVVAASAELAATVRAVLASAAL